MDNKKLAEILESIQFAIDAHATAQANNYLPRHAVVFFETAIGELKAAKYRLQSAMRKPESKY